MMHQSHTTKTYDRWSGFYDKTFAPMVERRLRYAIAEMHLKAGDRVLDLGVGTGNSFEYVPRDVEIVGLDISAGMLRRAKLKAERLGLEDRVRLVQGDALNPPFPARSFDHILLTHVVSVVTDPATLMARAAELIRPGGRIVIVNHFKSRRRAVAAMQRAVNPVCKKLGWRSDLAMASLVGSSHLRIVRHFKLKPLDVWRIVVLEGAGGPQPSVRAESERVLAAR